MHNKRIDKVIFNHQSLLVFIVIHKNKVMSESSWIQHEKKEKIMTEESNYRREMMMISFE